MRVMAAGDRPSPALRSLAFNSVADVDAHVTADALRGVVLVAEHPVDLLGKPRRHRRREGAAGLQHPDELGDRRGVGLDVFEHLAGDDAVEAAVGERQSSCVALQAADETLFGDLAGLGHRRERGPGAGHLAWRVVERDDVGALPSELERVPAEAGAGVEHQVARAHAELVEADRQQLQPTVPTQLGDVVGHRQHLAVLVDRQLGAVLPTPPLDDSTATCLADAGAQFGVVEARGGSPRRARRRRRPCTAAPSRRRGR